MLGIDLCSVLFRRLNRLEADYNLFRSLGGKN